MFRLDNVKLRSSDELMDSDFPVEISELFRRFQGGSFENGLYRVLTLRQSKSIDEQVTVAFPEFSGKIVCFSTDWLGRVFAIENCKNRSQNKIFMFEPGSAQTLEILCGVEKFHAEELIQYKEEALAFSFYREWLTSGGGAPDQENCISYKIPLYLGGIDEVENLEMSNLDVYW